MGAAIGPIIAAAVARAERESVEHFRLAGATAPERSIPLPEPGRRIGQRQVERWVRNGVLQPGPGGYWLDEAAFAQHAGTKRQVKVLFVVGLMLLALLLAGLGGLTGTRVGQAQ